MLIKQQNRENLSLFLTKSLTFFTLIRRNINKCYEEYAVFINLITLYNVCISYL